VQGEVTLEGAPKILQQPFQGNTIQVQEVIEEIETIEPSRLVQQQQRRLQRRTSPAQKAKGSSCCTVLLMAVITLSLLAILGLLLKDQFFYEYDLKGYIDISRLDLDSSNYNKISNLEAGTIIVTDMDGNKGIVEDTFFNIMMGQVVCREMMPQSQKGSKGHGHHTWPDMAGYHHSPQVQGYPSPQQDFEEFPQNSVPHDFRKNVVGIAKHNLFKSNICPKFIISDVRCSGRETKLKKCAYKVEYADCSDIQRAAGVVCNGPIENNIEKPTCPSTLLLGGSSGSEGDVMTMNSNLEFGPVCDATFGYNEAMTVCRELGYIGAKFMSGGSYFQPIADALSNLPFAITTLECRENDNKITDCYGNNNVHEMCNIDTGAGVICE